MNRSAQSGFGGVALADALQDALDVAESIGIDDVGDGCQRFRVSHIALSGGETQEISFQGIHRNIALRFEKQGQLMSIGAETSGLEVLGDAFMQPRRTPAS